MCVCVCTIVSTEAHAPGTAFESLDDFGAGRLPDAVSQEVHGTARRPDRDSVAAVGERVGGAEDVLHAR